MKYPHVWCKCQVCGENLCLSITILSLTFRLKHNLKFGNFVVKNTLDLFQVSIVFNLKINKKCSLQQFKIRLREHCSKAACIAVNTDMSDRLK